MVIRHILFSQAFAAILAFSPHPSRNPRQFSRTINFAGGSSQFHVGGIIPIELSFTASAADAFDMNTRNYDRSGRLDMEQFHVNPPGRDPLEQYYAVGAFIGGGLGGSATLNDEPRKMVEDLNEWMALGEKCRLRQLCATPGSFAISSSERSCSRQSSRHASIGFK